MNARRFTHVRRDQPLVLNTTMITLLVVLVALLIVVVLLVAILLLLRHRRKTLKARSLQAIKESRNSTSSVRSSHRRVLARPPPSIHILQNRQLFENSPERPTTPSSLPEIRITFPEEVDLSGRRQSGRVVVVRVGDSNIDPEPVEMAPAYQQSEGERFDTIDLERVGGLSEKDSPPPAGWR